MRPLDRLGFAKNDRFELRRALGEGGMGVVYEALDRDSGAVVALKTLRHLDPTSLYRFKQEFREAQDLHHPNLVTLGELIADEGQWFFTMELVDGVDFTTYVCEGSDVDPHAKTIAAPLPATSGHPLSIRSVRAVSPFDETRLRAALVGLGKGLRALHESGKVHRDIKPSNVLVTREGRVVLLDFGLLSDARALEPGDAMVGTLGYMAPEQAAAEEVGPSADWYAVGAMLFEALTARAPFEGGPIDVLRRKLARSVPPRPRMFVPHVPKDLDALCIELMHPDPLQRPSGNDVLARLGVREEARPQAMFVGRATELGVLGAAFEESRSGRATVVLVHGESGVGKSALVREMLGRIARGAPQAVELVGRCYEREQAPYKGFDGVVDAIAGYLASLNEADAAAVVPSDAAILARVFSVLRRVPLIDEMTEPPSGPVDRLESRKRAFAVLRELLARLASMRPVVLFLDDFQWADADSRALLRDLLEPPGAPPILVLLTSREASVDPLPVKVRTIHLEGLSVDESRALVALLRSDGDAAVDSQVIARETGGHPLFIQELVRHAAPPARALRLDDALWARIAELPLAARHVLEHIAIAGAPLAQKTLARAAELDRVAHAKWIAALRGAHLVRTSGAQASDVAEAYHDRVREAVLAHMDDDAKRRHHARLARALEEEGETRDRLALVRHLEGAGETLAAARQAASAAASAEDALAFEAAADLYRTALRLGEHDDATGRALRTKLATALANAGHGIEAASAFLDAGGGADEQTRAECMRRAGALFLCSGEVDQGMRTLERVLGDLGDPLPSSPGRVVASLLWNRARLRVRGHGYRKADVRAIAPPSLARLETYHAVATSLSMVDPVSAAVYQARALLLALDLGDPRRIGRALALEAIHLASQGSLVRARTIAEEASGVAEAEGDPYLSAMACAAEGIVAYYACDYRVANDVLLDAEALFRNRATGAWWELSTVRMFRFGALATVGHFAELDKCVDECLKDAARRDDRYTESSMTRMFNVTWLVRDEPDDARRALDAKQWTPPAGTFHIQHFFELMARVEIDLYTGDVSSTRARLGPTIDALEGSLLMRLQTARAMAHWFLGRLSLAEGDVRAAMARAHRLEREGLAPASVCARLLRAAVATKERDDMSALAHLDAAIEHGESAYLLFWTAIARRRRGELLGGDEGTALVGEADLWLRNQGVRRPDRFAATVVPPFR